MTTLIQRYEVTGHAIGGPDTDVVVRLSGSQPTVSTIPNELKAEFFFDGGHDAIVVNGFTDGDTQPFIVYCFVTEWTARIANILRLSIDGYALDANLDGFPVFALPQSGWGNPLPEPFSGYSGVVTIQDDGSIGLGYGYNSGYDRYRHIPVWKKNGEIKHPRFALMVPVALRHWPIPPNVQVSLRSIIGFDQPRIHFKAASSLVDDYVTPSNVLQPTYSSYYGDKIQGLWEEVTITRIDEALYPAKEWYEWGRADRVHLDAVYQIFVNGSVSNPDTASGYHAFSSPFSVVPYNPQPLDTPTTYTFASSYADGVEAYPSNGWPFWITANQGSFVSIQVTTTNMTCMVAHVGSGGNEPIVFQVRSAEGRRTPAYAFNATFETTSPEGEDMFYLLKDFFYGPGTAQLTATVMNAVVNPSLTLTTSTVSNIFNITPNFLSNGSPAPLEHKVTKHSLGSTFFTIKKPNGDIVLTGWRDAAQAPVKINRLHFPDSTFTVEVTQFTTAGPLVESTTFVGTGGLLASSWAKQGDLVTCSLSGVMNSSDLQIFATGTTNMGLSTNKSRVGYYPLDEFPSLTVTATVNGQPYSGVIYEGINHPVIGAFWHSDGLSDTADFSFWIDPVTLPAGTNNIQVFVSSASSVAPLSYSYTQQGRPAELVSYGQSISVTDDGSLTDTGYEKFKWLTFQGQKYDRIRHYDALGIFDSEFQPVPGFCPNSFIWNSVLHKTGTFYIRVSEGTNFVFNKETPPDYPGPGSPPITPNPTAVVPLTSGIPLENQTVKGYDAVGVRRTPSKRYSFTGNAGQVAEIQVTSSDGYDDYIMTVKAPSGVIVAEGISGSSLVLTLPVSGTYEIECAPRSHPRPPFSIVVDVTTPIVP